MRRPSIASGSAPTFTLALLDHMGDRQPVGQWEHAAASVARDGLDFARKITDAFPREAKEKLASDTLLDRLENLRPGFKACAASLEAPR